MAFWCGVRCVGGVVDRGRKGQGWESAEIGTYSVELEWSDCGRIRVLKELDKR